MEEESKNNTTNLPAMEQIPTYNRTTDIVFGKSQGGLCHQAQLVFKQVKERVLATFKNPDTSVKNDELIEAIRSGIEEKIPNYRLVHSEKDEEASKHSSVNVYKYFIIPKTMETEKLWDRTKAKKYDNRKKRKKLLGTNDGNDPMFEQFQKYKRWKMSQTGFEDLSDIDEKDIKSFEEFFEYWTWKNIKEYNEEMNKKKTSKSSSKSVSKCKSKSRSKSRPKSASTSASKSASKSVSKSLLKSVSKSVPKSASTSKKKKSTRQDSSPVRKKLQPPNDNSSNTSNPFSDDTNSNNESSSDDDNNGVPKIIKRTGNTPRRTRAVVNYEDDSDVSDFDKKVLEVFIIPKKKFR